MSMLVEEYPPNIIELIAKYGQENINSINVDDAYINQVNGLTQGQSTNLMWQYQRKGRLTASNFFSALHCRSDSTDNYIVRNILGKYQFTSKSVEHGKQHEPVARGKYVEIMSRQHISFHCSETGLHVYKEYPYLAASPDGIIECKCCGKGLLEIKCPFSLRHELAQVAMAKNSSCLLSNGKYELKRICHPHTMFRCLVKWQFVTFHFVILSCVHRKTCTLKECNLQLKTGGQWFRS